MAKMTDIPFAVQKGETGIAQNSDETLVNMFAEVTTSGRSQLVRRQRPCLRRKVALAGEKRAIERHKGVHYLVSGATFYTYDGTTLTSRGTLSTSTGRCTIIFNDLDDAMISDGENGYHWNGTILATVTKDPAMNVGTLAYLGGYGVANDIGTGKFYSTQANDFSDFDALDFATAESDPDPLYRVFSDHNELWMGGQRTMEIWQLSGSGDFPFSPLSAAKMERGIAAPLSMASEANTVIWLGDDLVVYRGDGYRPNRVSTYAIERAIRQVESPEDGYALLYQYDGHKFYALTFPDELTVVLDLTTGFWCFNTSEGTDGAWDVVGSAGKYTDYVLTPDAICEFTDEVNRDDGATVTRLARSAPGDADGARITITELFADCEVGHADAGAEVFLRFAPDAETFGTARPRSLGETGDYSARPVWRGVGQGRKPTIELYATGDFNFSIMGVKINAGISSS